MALRALGIAISIDDYGTGQSTLSYLQKLPATELKIDRSFVQLILASRSDWTVVDSTIKLAHALGLSVVAEGVESQDIMDALTSMECDEQQGYFTGRPMPFAQFCKRLEAGRRTVHRAA
jgi:EAL domain-containing protein (putative c-di-GMP-specific phosphodiesterase class I)